MKCSFSKIHPLLQVSEYPKESLTGLAATLPPASVAPVPEDVVDGLEGDGVEEDGDIYL